MKKVILCLVVLSMVITATAQEKKFSWGVKAGINLSSVFAKMPSEAKLVPKVDFVGGVFANYRINSWFGVGAEFLYSGQGYGVKYDGRLSSMLGLTEPIYMDLPYINIPLLATFRVFDGLTLKTGLQPGFLLGVQTRVGSNTESLTNHGLNVFDLSIPIAVEYQFKFGLLIDLRYNIGVTRINPATDGGSNDPIGNSVAALTVGWRF